LLDGRKTDPRGVNSLGISCRKLRLGGPFCDRPTTLEIAKTAHNKNIPIQIWSQPTKYADSTIGRGSFLPKEFAKFWTFLVPFLRDYLYNQIFGFVSELKPY
jgi:hypothetical protein